MFNEIRMSVFNTAFRYFVPLFAAVVCLSISTHSNAETNDLMKGLAGLVNQIEQKDNPSNTKSAQDIKQPQAQPQNQNQEQQPQSIPPAASPGKTAADEAATSEAAKVDAEKSLAAIAKAEAEINAELAAAKTEVVKAEAVKAEAAIAETAAPNKMLPIIMGSYTIIFTIVLLIFFSNSVRKSVPNGNGNFSVRNLSHALPWAGVTLLLIGVSSLAFVGNLLLALLIPFGIICAKAFAVEEAGVAFDADKKTLEVSAAGVEADSILDYINPSFLLKFLRRDHIPVDSIKSLGGASTTTTTRTYDKDAGKYDTRIKTTHALDISSSLGQWTITFGSRQKADAARTLIAEVANLRSEFAQS